MMEKKERKFKPREGGGKFYKAFKKKSCRFCTDAANVDYKNIGLLRSFLTERAKIVPRRTTGNCAKHQRQLTTAIKRARTLAFLPYVMD